MLVEILGGGYRNRTDLHGFAIQRIACLPTRQPAAVLRFQFHRRQALSTFAVLAEAGSAVFWKMEPKRWLKSRSGTWEGMVFQACALMWRGLPEEPNAG